MSVFGSGNTGKDSGLRIAFLGDSITDQGLYIAYMEALFLLFRPEQGFEWIPLGVSSETAAGLSEPAHPFPRPWVFDRLAAALRESRPDWVAVCYGMNDGIYHPLSDDRFLAYRKGMTDLIGRIRQAGARVIALTPPPFDAGSFDAAKLVPEDAADFSYLTPYRDYDRVLEAYAGWVLTDDCPADVRIDIRTPLLRHTSERRALDPFYRTGDGIHPNPSGHGVMARTLLDRLFGLSGGQLPDEWERILAGTSGRSAKVLQRFELVRTLWKKRLGYPVTGGIGVDLLPEDIQEDIRRMTAEIRD